MNVAGLLIFITIGAGAGWLAGAFMNKKHTTLVHSKGLTIIGAMVGALLFVLLRVIGSC